MSETNYYAIVIQTNNYDTFKPIDGNRDINILHLKRLIKSFKQEYLFSPIIVNEHYQIIDGQHRFNAAKELGLPIYYIMKIGYGLKEVQILNANSKNWSATDFLKGYCDLGYKPYLQYKEFMDKYQLSHNVCMALLSGTTHTGLIVKKFYNGSFEVFNFELAEKDAEKIMKVKKFYSGYDRHSFVIALIGLFKNPEFIFDEFLHKLKLQPNALVNCSSVPQYKSLIESIYNYRRSNKVNLRF